LKATYIGKMLFKDINAPVVVVVVDVVVVVVVV